MQKTFRLRHYGIREAADMAPALNIVREAYESIAE